MKLNKLMNPYHVYDKASERREGKSDQIELTRIEQDFILPQYDKTGRLEYVLFKSKEARETKVRILRLFRVKSVSNLVRFEEDNNANFKNILNDFRETGTSFVTLYACEAGHDNIISYGVLVEGSEAKQDELIHKSYKSVKALEKQFRGSYHCIDLQPFTHHEAWVIDKFYSKHSTYVRGIPSSDESLGAQSRSVYSSPQKMGRQVCETFLRTMSAKVDDTGKIAQGESFLAYVVLSPLEAEKIQRGFEMLQNMASKTDSSSTQNISESENFSLPLMFGFGFGEMFGHTTAATSGETHTTGDSIADGDTHTVSSNETNTEGEGEGTTQTNSHQNSSTTTNNQGKGGNVGASLFVTDTWNWQEGKSEAEGETVGEQNGTTTNTSTSKAVGTGESSGQSLVNTKSNSEAVSASKSTGDSSQKGNNLSGAGGVNIGDGSGISRMIKDHFQEFATELTKLNERRYRYGKVEGMFGFRMVILTNDEEAKMTAEEAIKQAYLDREAPIPIRIVEFKNKEEETKARRYAQVMARPYVKETRNLLVEDNAMETNITAVEATAFSLPQDNFYGYTSSIDPIPEKIVHFGDMGEGAKIGKQWDRKFNLMSEHPFVIPRDKVKGHIGIFGGTGQGKTVFTQKFVAELHNQYGFNFILFDWKRNHRSVCMHLDNDKHFRYNSFQSNLFPLKINPIEPPKGVPSYEWDPIISEIFCHTAGLGGRSYLIVITCLNALRERMAKSGKAPTILDLIDQVDIELERAAAESPTGRIGFKTADTFESMSTRFKIWKMKNRPSYEALCVGPFVPVHQLIEGKFVHVIECAALPKDTRKFTINTLSSAIFQYCAHRGKKLETPMYMIFEEAHTVLGEPTGNEPLPIDETIFEVMSREARNDNLYLGYVCQSPEKLQDIIFDNMPLRVSFNLSDKSGKERLISASGHDPSRLDVELVNWLSRQPEGMCLMRFGNFKNISEGELVALKVDMLLSKEMDDDFFRKVYKKGVTNLT